MSSDRPREYFFDRSLGKKSAEGLRAAGYTVHLIADFYADDAEDVADTEWVAEGCRRGWVLLTKDRRIRYRPDEIAALDGALFCLADGNVPVDVVVERFLAAMPAIERTVRRRPAGFWHVYDSGRIRLMWPR